MSTIRCKMFHASHSKPPPYVAISYTWGDAGDKKDIQVDGHVVSITTSLHGAFEAVRRKDKSVFVWADALCINQQDNDERSQQVAMMSAIYSAATSVAIWLGPEDDDSSMAMDFLLGVAERADSPENIQKAIFSQARQHDLSATIALFEREYWDRLWIVQEVLNAQTITVYCGRSKLPWSVFKIASATFDRHKNDLFDNFAIAGSTEHRRRSANSKQYGRDKVLTHRGPASLKIDVSSLHETILACRSKLASNGIDKVYGLLGVLTVDLRHDFPIDYTLSIKEVYTNLVDHVITTTERLNIISDAVYYPICLTATILPTWVPDYSQYPSILPMWKCGDFSAAQTSKARADILDSRGRRNKLRISAIYLDTLSTTGMALGTLNNFSTYLVVFLQWRALLLATLRVRDRAELELVQEDFAATLCLDQLPKRWKRPEEWFTVCYHAFASCLRQALPYLPLDEELDSFADASVDIDESEADKIVENLSDQWGGRCFCITETGLLGMGSGFMNEDDVVVVPLGCSTPVILRPVGTRGEYRFVGDIYIHGYMYGRAFDEMKEGRRDLTEYVIC